MLSIGGFKVAGSEKTIQMLVGDMYILQVLLPQSELAARLDTLKETPVLSLGEVARFREELEAIDLGALERKPYYRSASCPELQATRQELIERLLDELPA